MKDRDFDLLLFTRLKSGNEEALELLFKKYYSPLCNFTNTYLNNTHLSEDLISDLFADIWFKRSKIKVSQNVKAYLFQSAKNNTLAYIRKKKLETEDISNLNTLKLSHKPNAYLKLDREQKQQDIEYILQKIPPRSRQVFVLHRFEEMKYKEIAALLNISAKTVENHMNKALKILHTNKDLIEKLLKIIIVAAAFSEAIYSS